MRVVLAAAVVILCATTTTVASATAGRPRAPFVVDPSGQTMPVGDLPGWKQVFADNFPTNVPLGHFPADDLMKWSAYPDGWPDTSRHGRYSPSEVVSIQNGTMRMHLHTVRRTHLVSAPVPRLSRQGDASKGMLYGRYIVRYKADPVPGYKVAWLLWPDSDNWSDGEIDFPEGNLDGTTSAFVHHKGSPRVQNAYLTTATFTTWHTAEIEWTRAYIRFVLDGIVVGLSTDTAHIPGVPMHWVLQTETAVGKAAPADSSSGNVYIDWAVAYAAAR